MLCFVVKVSVLQSTSRGQLTVFFLGDAGLSPLIKRQGFPLFEPLCCRTLKDLSFLSLFCSKQTEVEVEAVSQLEIQGRSFPVLAYSSRGASQADPTGFFCKIWQGAAGNCHLLTACIKFKISRKLCSLYGTVLQHLLRSHVINESKRMRLQPLHNGKSYGVALSGVI